MKKIVIIGGGIAGLSAGCYAKMNGYDVQIFEMHNIPGGLCTSWKRKGYTFDLCIHWLVGSAPDSPYHKIFQELGAIQGLKIYNRELSIKLFAKNKTIDFYNDLVKLSKQLKEIAPEDCKMIDTLLDGVRKCHQLYEIPLTKPKELMNIIDIFKILKSLSPCIKFLKKYSKLTIHDFAEKFKNPIIQQAIRSFEFDSLTNDAYIIPFSLATKNYGFPQGGSLSFARRIQQRFTNLGGNIQYNCKVRKILVDKNTVTGIQLEDGTILNADIVISAADGHSTIFKMLEGKYQTKRITKYYEKQLVTPSYLQVSIGVDMDLSKYASINSIYNLYELDQPIIISGEKRDYIQIENYAFDPTLSPPGKTPLVIAFFSKAAYWEKIYSDKIKYKKEKEIVEKTIISSLEKIIPGIKEKIEVVDVATPMTIIRYTNNWQGSINGFFRPFLLNIPRTFPNLKGFFMAGQWVGDSSVSGAAQSGRSCIEYLCKKDNKRFIATMP